MRRATQKFLRGKSIKAELKHLRYQNYHSELTVVGIEMHHRFTDVKKRHAANSLAGIKASISTRNIRIAQLKLERKAGEYSLR